MLSTSSIVSNKYTEELKLVKEARELLPQVGRIFHLRNVPEENRELVVDLLDNNLPDDLNPLKTIETNITMQQAILLAQINQNPNDCDKFLYELFNTSDGYAVTLKESGLGKDLKNPDIFQIFEVMLWSSVLEKLSNYSRIWKSKNLKKLNKRQLMTLYFKCLMLKSKINDSTDLYELYIKQKELERCADFYLKNPKKCKDCSKCKNRFDWETMTV